jgi:multiple sugar transport system permease protein
MTQLAAAPASPTFSRKKRSNPMGYLFALPYVAHFLVFTAYPLGFALYLTTHRWDIVSSDKPFVGARYFGKLLRDDLFFIALKNTLVFLAVHVPLQIVVALLLAVVLNGRVRFRTFFRTAFFLPYVTSGAVIAIIWTQLYAGDGLLNGILRAVHLPPVEWLTSPALAMPSIAIMATWKNVGYYLMIFLAGLQSIPESLYEEATLNGATPWQRFYYITLPLLNPAMLMVLVLSTIGAFSLFVEPFVMTGGGPVDSTLSVVLLLYRNAFQFLNMGYASTIGVVLALIIFAVTWLQRRVVEQELTY